MYRFAIIGCGEAGALHAEAIGEGLAAVCDVVKAKADELAARYKVSAFYSIEELLKGSEATVICVCTPNGYHAEHCIKSLQAGRHVVCETPFCLTKAGAWQTIETEKFCGRKLIVANPNAMDRKEFKTFAADSFHLKCTARLDPTYDSWRGTSFPGGGLLYAAFHDGIDALVKIFGPVREVNGSLLPSQSNREIESGGQATLLMENGVSGKIEWAFGDETAIRFTINTKEDDLARDTAATGFYPWFYQQLPAALEGRTHSLSEILEASVTVEAIEKIYRAVSPNPSS